jgi:hypothetical protein
LVKQSVLFNCHLILRRPDGFVPSAAPIQVTHKDSLSQITEITGAAITTRGQFFRAGMQPPPGERKLFLLIEGPTELSVKRAKQEIKRILEEATEKVPLPLYTPLSSYKALKPFLAMAALKSTLQASS